MKTQFLLGGSSRKVIGGFQPNKPHKPGVKPFGGSTVQKPPKPANK